MYKCSNCGGMMSQPLDKCPHCNIVLSGVKCTSCGYFGGKSEFTNNNHRCPKCNNAVYISGAPSSGTASGNGPGVGLALLSILLTFFAPGFAGILSYYVVSKTSDDNARKVAYIGIVLNVILVVGWVLLLFL